MVWLDVGLLLHRCGFILVWFPGVAEITRSSPWPWTPYVTKVHSSHRRQSYTPQARLTLRVKHPTMASTVKPSAPGQGCMAARPYPGVSTTSVFAGLHAKTSEAPAHPRMITHRSMLRQPPRPRLARAGEHYGGAPSSTTTVPAPAPSMYPGPKREQLPMRHAPIGLPLLLRLGHLQCPVHRALLHGLAMLHRPERHRGRHAHEWHPWPRSIPSAAALSSDPARRAAESAGTATRSSVASPPAAG